MGCQQNIEWLISPPTSCLLSDSDTLCQFAGKGRNKIVTESVSPVTSKISYALLQIVQINFNIVDELRSKTRVKWYLKLGYSLFRGIGTYMKNGHQN